MKTITEENTKLLKFTVNTTYNRLDVGPDYHDEPIEVDAKWATIFLEQGRAEEVLPEPEADDQTDGGEAGDDVTTTEVKAEVSTPEVAKEAEPVAEKSGLDTDSANPVVSKPSGKKK